MSIKNVVQMFRTLVSRPAMMVIRDQDVESIVRTIARATEEDYDNLVKRLVSYYDSEMKSDE